MAEAEKGRQKVIEAEEKHIRILRGSHKIPGLRHCGLISFESISAGWLNVLLKRH